MRMGALMVPVVDKEEREQEGDAEEGREDEAREEGVLDVGRVGISICFDLWMEVRREGVG